MKKSIELGDQLLKGLYKTASPADKLILEDKYGKEFFTKNILDEENPYEAACAMQGLDPIDELPFADPKNTRQEAANAYVKLDIIAEALRDGVLLDFTPGNQQDKWWPWFNQYKPGSGFRFDGSGRVWSASSAFGGARLAVYTKAKSDEFGTKCLDIWNKFLNPNK